MTSVSISKKKPITSNLTNIIDNQLNKEDSTAVLENVVILGSLSVSGNTNLSGGSNQVGPAGPQGIQGIQGIKGDTGATGMTGPAGPAGTSSAGAGITLFLNNQDHPNDTTAGILTHRLTEAPQSQLTTSSIIHTFNNGNPLEMGYWTFQLTQSSYIEGGTWLLNLYAETTTAAPILVYFVLNYTNISQQTQVWATSDTVSVIGALREYKIPIDVSSVILDNATRKVLLSIYATDITQTNTLRIRLLALKSKLKSLRRPLPMLIRIFISLIYQALKQ